MIGDDVDTSAAGSTDPLHAWYLDIDTLSAWYDDTFPDTGHIDLGDSDTSLSSTPESDISLITCVETESDLHVEGFNRSSSIMGNMRCTLA